MAQISANGITLEYEVRGSGEPILFIMGLSGQLTDWPQEFIDMFVKRGHQVILFDNRDIGLSTKDTWEPPSQIATVASMLTRRPLKGVGYTVADMADDAAGLLAGLGVDAAHVVGISMGGMISQELAIRHPSRVRSLCSIMSNTGDRKRGGFTWRLIAKVGRPPEPDLATAVDEVAKINELISGPHYDSLEARSMIEKSIARNFSPDGVLRQTAAIAGSRDRTKLLRNVQAPTLVIHGLLDPLVKHSGGEATAAAVPNARLLSLPDMAHDLPRPRWSELCDAIAQNFSRADADTPVTV